MSFFADKVVSEGLTFDDVLLIPSYSEVLPRDVELTSWFTRNIRLNTPIVTAAMDTVTDSRMAIAIAREGGIGVIHKNMSITEQARQVTSVKRAENGMIYDPVTISKEKTVRDAIGLMKTFKIGGIPVIDEQGCLVGIVTNRDLRFENDMNKLVSEVMTKDNLITTNLSTSLELASAILQKYKIEELVRAQADAIVIDTAHGHSMYVLEMLKKAKNRYPEIDFVAGNIVTPEAASDMVLAGADAVKVGVGHGSIFAGVEESPGDTILFQGRKFKTYRGMGSLEAMQLGSKDRYFQDMEDDIKKLVPEGIVARVPYKGSLDEVLLQLTGGIRAGMGYCGAKDIETLQYAKFIRITNSGIQESHPHDVSITSESPNYSSR